MMLKQGAKRILRAVGLQRAQLAAARMAAERAGLATMPQSRAGRTGGRILAYHSVAQPQTGVNDVSLKRFERQLDMLKELDFEIVPASEIATSGGAPDQIAITVDDAWTSAADVIAPVLRRRDLPWSLFVVSQWSDHTDEWTRDTILDWEALKRLQGSDLEIGSHSVTHPDFAKLSASEITRELHASRARIEDCLGFAPASFAIPFGQSMNWTDEAQDLAQLAGYDVIYAQAENTRHPGTVGRTFVTKYDNDRIFRALLNGAFDNWEEWV